MTEPVAHQPVSYLEGNAERFGDRLAVWDNGREVGFRDLLNSTRLLMAWLRHQEVGEGEVVAVSLPNVWEYVALELAIPAVGAVILPLPLSLGRYEIESALAATNATIVIVPSGEDGTVLRQVASALARPTRVVSVDDLFEAPLVEVQVPPPVPADAARVVEIALTSGTTGMPKLASLSAELKQVTFESFTSKLEIEPDDRVLVMSPLTQGIGGMCLYCLRAGAALVLLGQPHFNADHTLRVAAASRATFLVGVPSNVSRLLACQGLGAADLGALRATAVAGSPMPPDTARRWEEATGARVCIFYGSMDAGQLAVGSPSDPRDKRWTTVGRPHRRAQLMICDGAGRPVGPGEVGEICMRGPLVQARYWGETRGPLAEDGWAHMGDLGLVDPEGYLHVVGRLKDVVIRGGANINPYEVEAILREHPAVEDACLVGRPDPDLGERPVAFLVLLPGCELTFEAMVDHLRSRGLARFKWPELIDELEELPLSGPGKLNRGALRERAAALPVPSR